MQHPLHDPMVETEAGFAGWRCALLPRLPETRHVLVQVLPTPLPSAGGVLLDARSASCPFLLLVAPSCWLANATAA